MSLVLGTRGSALALAQARIAAAMLGDDVELRVVRTHGDVSPGPLAQLGEGIFVTALEDALRRGEIDAAVHSLKDLPTGDRPGLVIGAVPNREDPRDVIIARDRSGLRALPARARVGTGSPRRAAFLRVLRPDLVPTDVRGNVDTRIQRVMRGEVDAVVLALAGVRRLGVTVSDEEILTLEEMPPAPGQGAIAVQCRAEDATTRRRLEAVDDASIRRATEAERAALRALGASCAIALGAFARADGAEIVIDVALAGEQVLRTQQRGVDPTELGERAARAVRGAVHA